MFMDIEHLFAAPGVDPHSSRLICMCQAAGYRKIECTKESRIDSKKKHAAPPLWVGGCGDSSILETRWQWKQSEALLFD